MDFERFGEGFGKIFYVRTPALSREAPRSVPMRGGPRPTSVLNDYSIWEGLANFVQVRLCQDPRAVSRSPAERLNARGSPPSAY